MREEGDKCEYEDTHASSSRQRLVTWDDFFDLRARLEKVEHMLELPSSSSSSRQNEDRPDSARSPSHSIEHVTTGSGPHQQHPAKVQGDRNDRKGHIDEIEDAANTLEELAVAAVQHRICTCHDLNHRTHQYHRHHPRSPQDLCDSRPSTTDHRHHDLDNPQSIHRDRPRDLLSPTEPIRWPDITCPASSVRTGNRKWERDMNEILDVIPSDKVVLALVNEFFLETRRSCKLSLGVHS
jgi:hypothetical protein